MNQLGAAARICLWGGGWYSVEDDEGVTVASPGSFTWLMGSLKRGALRWPLRRTYRSLHGIAVFAQCAQHSQLCISGLLGTYRSYSAHRPNSGSQWRREANARAGLLRVTIRLRPVLRRGRDRGESVPVKLDVDRASVDAARRDPSAFEALYRKYVAQVYSFALYELRDQHAAEDLTAQVFLRALAGLPRFREQAQPPESSFRVWLFQIARNAISNEKRRLRRHPDTSIDLAVAIPASDDVSATAAQRDELRRVLAAIDELPDDRRRALVLRFVHEMNTREIGQVLGRSEGATRVLIHRSLQAVARQLGRRVGAGRSGAAESRRSRN